MSEQERARIMAEAQAKYGDNRWWESDDARTRAYYQLHEDILLYNFSQFHGDIEALLGRPVWTHELGLNIVGIRAEAEAAWPGTPYSDEDKEQAIENGFDALVATGKPIIVVEVGDGSADTGEE